MAAVTVTVVLVALFELPERGSLRGDQLAVAPLAEIDEMTALVVQGRRDSLARGEQSALAFGAGGIGAYKPALAP